MNKYKLGDVLIVTVVGIIDYGIFVSLEDGSKGLIHISEISDNFVSNINYFVELNEKIYAKIIGIDSIKNKYNLSIKNLNYKLNHNSRIQETPHGFRTLNRNLPFWIKENLKKEKNYKK